jgi:hypothetical protein
VRGVYHVAVARQTNRGRDQLAPRLGAEARVRELEARDCPGHARGARAQHAGRRHLALVVEVHVARRCERRCLAVVDRGLFASRGAYEHEASAAEIASGRMRDRERERQRDRGVDRVSTCLQHGERRGARLRFRAGDSAVHAHGHSVRIGLFSERR